MNYLFLYLDQIMVRIVQLIFHIVHNHSHLRIHGNSKKHRLLILYHILTPIDEHGYVLTLFIQISQFRKFNLITWFILICIVNITFQIDNITHSNHCNIFQTSFDFPLIIILTLFIIFFQIIFYILIETSQVIINKRNIDIFIHLQYIFKKFQIYILHLEKISAVSYYSIVNKILYPFFLILRKLQGIVVLKRRRCSFVEHFL